MPSCQLAGGQPQSAPTIRPHLLNYVGRGVPILTPKTFNHFPKKRRKRLISVFFRCPIFVGRENQRRANSRIACLTPLKGSMLSFSLPLSLLCQFLCLSFFRDWFVTPFFHPKEKLVLRGRSGFFSRETCRDKLILFNKKVEVLFSQTLSVPFAEETPKFLFFSRSLFSARSRVGQTKKFVGPTQIKLVLISGPAPRSGFTRATHIPGRLSLPRAPGGLRASSESCCLPQKKEL